MLRNWKDIAIALVLAVLTWYLITGREKVETWVDMGVEMANAPDGLTIRKGLISKIEVRVRGPKGLVRSLDRRKWTYSLDVSRLKVGENLVDIDRERIPLSMAYEVIEVKPSRLILTVDSIAKKEVPVTAEWKGALRADYRLLDIQVQPEVVELKGAEKLLRQMNQVRVSVPAEFDEPPAQWSEDVPIKLMEGVEVNPGQIRVTMRFGPEVKTAWIRVPLHVELPDDMELVRPPKFLRLNMEGPVSQMREAEAGRDIKGLAAVARVTPGVKAGPLTVSYELETPSGFRLVERPSATLNLRLRKK